jgi:hypothetical protein
VIGLPHTIQLGLAASQFFLFETGKIQLTRHACCKMNCET